MTRILPERLRPRDKRGRLLPIDAMTRFAAKCRFDATTGCVVWIGGKTRGRGNTAQYGSFWFEGARWFAHRWAGVFIHRLDLNGVQAGHTCANSLCVEHVTAQTQLENMREMNTRRWRRVEQSNAERQFWLLVELGYEELPPVPEVDAEAIPFHTPPEWLQPFMAQPEIEECPF